MCYIEQQIPKDEQIDLKEWVKEHGYEYIFESQKLGLL